MKKNQKYIYLALLFGIATFFFFKNNFDEFEPTVFENDSFRKIEVNSTFYKNLIIVLDYSKVNYKIGDKGKILVDNSLIKDKELLFNYTKKALDTAWINLHRKAK